MIQCHDIGRKPNQKTHEDENPRHKPDSDHNSVGKCEHCGDILPLRSDPIRGRICAECDSDEDAVSDAFNADRFGWDE